MDSRQPEHGGTVTPAARPAWRRRSDDSTVPPARPRAFTADQLRFTPQRATRWFSPGVLAASGLHVGVTSAFGSFLDKRELQESKAATPDLRYAGRDELWLDYVADTGDGFEATATVASQVGRGELHVAGVDTPLPRGEILVLGGDEVYPGASTEGYENRLEGPWRAALPWTEPGPVEPAHPSVYAIPGNHDWYDGLTGFLRLFGQGRWLGGWRTQQTRSYFAVQLPHRWWLWGIDIQADALIDEPQLEFFAGVVADHAQAGDRLVLATAVPTWTQLQSDPHAYRNLAYLERALLRPADIRLKLTLAGDVHHYARYAHEGPESEIGPTYKITSGGGGAFLHPTHDLPPAAPIAVDPDDPHDVVDYALAARYPTAGRSRLLSLRALLLVVRNPSFVLVPGVVNVVLLWTVQFGLRSLDGGEGSFAVAGSRWGWTDMAGGMFRNSMSALLLLVLFAALWAFAKPPSWAPLRWPRYLTKTALALAHAAAQILTIATVAVGALTVASAVGDGGGTVDAWVFAAVASLFALVVGGVACSLVMGAYLALAIGLPGLRAHANEAFAAARITGYKNFLRLHIDTAGALTVYALGIDKAVKRRHWRAVPEAASPEAAWIEPTQGAPHPRLVDQITLP